MGGAHQVVRPDPRPTGFMYMMPRTTRAVFLRPTLMGKSRFHAFGQGSRDARIEGRSASAQDRMATNRPSAPCRPTRFSRPDRRLFVLIGTQGRVSPAALPDTDNDAQSPGVYLQFLCNAHRLTVRRSPAVPPYFLSFCLSVSSPDIRNKRRC
jgi:hypothetical protein